MTAAGTGNTREGGVFMTKVETGGQETTVGATRGTGTIYTEEAA